MGRRKTALPSSGCVLGVLTEEERRVIADWETILGLEPDGLFRIASPLLVAVAALRVAARLQRERPGLAAGNALRDAIESLGVVDDGRLACHPADTVIRQLRRWRDGACGHHAPAPTIRVA